MPSTTMLDEVRLKMLNELRGAAWTEFDTRRAYEWKITIAVWTALGICLTTIITSKPAFDTIAKVGLGAVSLLVFFLHAKFVHGVAKANGTSRDKEETYLREMHTLLDIRFDSSIETAINAAKAKSGEWRHWSLLLQVGLTALLLLAIFVVLP